MEFEGICLNCFSQRGVYEVCPYCGYVAGAVPAEGYILLPGTRLWGRYVVGTVLGTGGFGITYRAWDTRLNAMVAIKEFFPQSLVSRMPGEGKVRVFSGDRQEAYAQQLGRFMDEAKNLAKFTGDALIVNVLDFFEDNGTAYIVMEYLDGVTLKEYMAQRGGRLPTAEALAIETDLLKALTNIHAKGIIHRDISPDNIFILRGGTMKVLDFGAARFAVREDSAFTQGVVVKKGYAPPEQYRTNMKQGVWTDIYAAGATLYKMMTGITPEESIERTEKDVLKRPSQTGTAVDAAVDKAVMKAMALRPELRFKSADAMLAALENRTVIDFPEEELKKRRGRNGVLVAVSVLVVLSLAVLVALQAAKAPVVTGGPSLANMEIAPDSITVFTYDNEAQTEAFAQLAAAFMEKYPQHTVEIETYTWYDGIGADLSPRFASDAAPTVFPAYFSDLDQEETPYMADLTLLYNSIDTGDYLFLQDYLAEEQKDNENAEMYDLPTGFEFEVAYVNQVGAQERGLDAPTAITSYDELVALEKQMPGTVDIQAHEMGNLLGILEPQLFDNEDLGALEDLVGEYAALYQQGYFRTWSNTGEVEYQYDNMMLEFSGSYTSNIRWRQQNGQGQYTLIPVVADGKIAASLRNTYSVSSYASDNQQKVGMLFLHFMLSEYGQNVLYVQHDDLQPLQVGALAQYVEANPDFSFLTGAYAGKLQYGYRHFYFDDLDNVLNNEGGEEEARAIVRRIYGDDWGWS